MIVRPANARSHSNRRLCTCYQTKTVDLKQVNAVLMQPHWRHNVQDEPAQPIVLTNQKPNPNNQGQRTLRSK
jgi:hypothetical protein